MAHMPASASFQSDCALVSRYAAARGHAETSPEMDQQTAASGVSSSPNALFSQRISNGSSFRPAPEMGSSVSHTPDDRKPGKDADQWPNGRGTLSTPDNDPNVTEATPLISNEWSDGRDSASQDNLDWWTELRVLSSYALPVFGTHVLEYSLSITPVVFIGHISTNALAAVTLGTMTASVTGLSIIIGFSTALDTMLPSAWTSGKPSLVGLITLRMTVLMAMILVPIFAIWMQAETILLSLRQDPEIARLAGLYLRWFSLGLPAYALNAVLRRFFQSQGLFSAPTRVLFIVAPINILLNYLLVWGPPWIALGFIGAPIATAISFNLITLFYCLYGLWVAPRVAWYPITKECLQGLGFLFKLGMAGVLQIAAEWWSWELVARQWGDLPLGPLLIPHAVAASQLGPIDLAVQSVCLVSASTSYQAPMSLGVATSVRVGNMLGARSAKGAALATRVAIFLTMVVAMLMSIIFLIFKKNWGFMFSKDPTVVGEVSRILPIVALFQVVDGLGAVTGAILRSQGKQEIGAWLNVVGYYIIGIPFGLVLAFKLGIGLIGLWVGLTCALVFVGSVGLYLCMIRSNWEEEVRKTMIRLGHEYDSDSTTSTVVP